MEVIIGIRRGEQFSKKELIIASGQLIFWLKETIFFSIFQRVLPVILFFSSGGKDVSRKCFIPASGKEKRKRKAANKRILFPLNKNFDSTSRNEGFVKKIRFHYAENLLSAAGIFIYIYKTRRKWFPIVGERLLCKKCFHLNFNNGFH